MARKEKHSTKRRLKPASSPEERESQLISLAMDAAEEQLANGTASSQVITHFLKLATVKEQLEREKLAADVELANAKKKELESNDERERLYRDAINAFRGYSGQDTEENDEYDYD